MKNIKETNRSIWYNKHRIDFTVNFFKDNLSSGKKVLEIGCYPYHITKKLSSIFSLYCIDIKKPTKGIGVEIKVCDAETDKIPYPDNTFDCVVFTEVLEHLAYPNNILKQIHRVLKDNGFLFLTTPNFYSYKTLSGILTGGGYLKHELWFKFKEEKPECRGHVRIYSMKNVKNLLKLFNFKVEDSGYFNWTPDEYVLVKLLKAISIIPFFRDGLFIKAKKII